MGLVLALAICAAALVTLATGNTPTSVVSYTGPPKAAELAVRAQRTDLGRQRVVLPNDGHGEAVVRGPRKFKKTLRQTRTLKRLVAGVYRVRARKVTVGNVHSVPKKTRKVRTVRSGKRSVVRMNYRKAKTRPAPFCSQRHTASVTGKVADSRLQEISGLGVSRTQSNVLWVHNDSGDGPTITAISKQGAPYSRHTLAGVAAKDWEDMSLGSALLDESGVVYVADFGDNAADRTKIRIHQLAEPDARGGDTTITTHSSMTLRYPAGAENAEALLIDPHTGHILIITKRVGAPASLFSAAWDSGADRTLKDRGQLGAAGIVTAADVSADGRTVLVRTYSAVKVWETQPTVPLWRQLTRAPDCTAPSAFERQGESIAIAPKGSKYFTISEGNRSPIQMFKPK